MLVSNLLISCQENSSCCNSCKVRICLSKIQIFLRKYPLWGHPCLQPCHAGGGAISIIEDQYLLMSREKILFPFYSPGCYRMLPHVCQAKLCNGKMQNYPCHRIALLCKRMQHFLLKKCTAMHDNAAPHFLTLGLWHCICYCRRI